MHPHPGDGLLALPVILHLEQLGLGGGSSVAADTRCEGRNPGLGREAGCAMAVQAVKAGLGVQSVAESDRLLGRVAPAGQPQIKEGKIPPGGLSSILHA